MTVREQIKTEIDYLSDDTVNKVLEYILFQKYQLGMYENDSAYLDSIPGMSASIKTGIETPLSECKPVSEVWTDV